MRSKLLAILVFLGLAAARNMPLEYNLTNWSGRNMTCHPALLDSYRLTPLSVPTSQKNFMCNGIANNCCPLDSQLKLFKRWTSPTGGRKLAKHYQDFIRNYQEIFRLFKQVEDFAKTIKDGLPPGATSNCGQLANSILKLNAVGLQNQVITDFQRAFRFLYDARRGFYCSLCDSDALSFILPQQGVYKVSKGFCASLVGETLNAMSFKYEYFQKIARLYGQIMVSCNGSGDYDPRAKLKRSAVFFSHKRIIRDVKTCKDNYKGSNAVGFCSRYCERFNPARLGRMFDGQVRKTGMFKRWLERTLRDITEKASSGQNKEDLNFKGRILQDTKAPAANASAAPAAGAANSTASANTTVAVKVAPVIAEPITIGIEQFNRNYSTQLVVPVSFNAQENPPQKRRRLSLRQSIFRLKDDPIFNIANFKTVVATVGLNPIKYGYNTFINNDSFKALDEAFKASGAKGAKVANSTATVAAKTNTTAAASASTPAAANTTATAKAAARRRRK